MANLHDSDASDRDESTETASTTTSEPETPPLKPPLALRSDGRLLVGVDAFGGRSLGDRELWVGATLTPEEEALIRDHCGNAAEEAAALLVGQLQAKKQ